MDTNRRWQASVEPTTVRRDLAREIAIEECEQMHRKLELIHRAWTKEREYLAPNTVGQLAELDHAQIVAPPHGFEIGCVPITIRQEMVPLDNDKK